MKTSGERPSGAAPDLDEEGEEIAEPVVEARHEVAWESLR